MRRKRWLVPVTVLAAALTTDCSEVVDVPDPLRAVGPPTTVDAVVVRLADSLAVAPDPLYVAQQDTIRWSRSGGDSLWIHLDGVQGFDGVVLKAPDTVVVVITNATNPNSYKYAATLWVADTAIFVDPRLIVRERGG